ncbi:MAG: DUF1080 domain-containing protein [Candidatus Omnitrophica bacterium]|nr:DUF1080 domain-containing protein [Candidatus Omnitrophota bacterium]
MTTIKQLCAYLLLFMSLTISAALSSDMDEGFVSLFNGENLDGWVIENGDQSTFIVDKGTIQSTGKTGPPAWLRSEKTYENYDLRFEFLMKGWCSSGLYFNAPLHGRQSKTGFEFQIYHDKKKDVKDYMCGAIFEALPPKVNAVASANQWNSGRIYLDWPILKMWLNDQLVQDINVNDYPELKYRLRRGYIGIQDVGYQAWFRNIRIKELAYKDEWISLFNGKDFDGWYEEGQGALWSVRDGVIHAEDSTSYMVTQDEFEDFEFHCYVRTSPNANGGIFYRWKELKGGDRGNEVQIENVPDSPHPTGSLYNVVRAVQPRFRDEEWFLMQILVKGSHIVIRVNGETTVDYDQLSIVRPGHIALQMHHHNKWVEWKDLKIKLIR